LSYSLQILRSAQKEMAKISPGDQQRIREAILRLADDARPAGSRKLTGLDAWRIRVGDYRVIYEIQDEVLTVLVVKIKHRRDVYR
jgi:mRNA interferase RelE/StbE